MKELSVLEHIVFVRFASVYRSFKDGSEFSTMVADLQNKQDND